MNNIRKCVLAVCFCVAATTGESVWGQQKEDNTVRQSIAVFNEIMAIPASGISKKLLSNARGIAIIPKVIKGSFVIGARRGNGVLLVRDDKGGWHAPVFVTLTGGNIGWQVGIQSTDVVLVFKTQKSIDGLLAGRFTLGVDAAVAAGPVGRQASAATDSGLGAEIYSYSRSRGLFLGVSFDGSEIRIDNIANGTYYRAPAPGAPVIIPPAATQLVNDILPYTGFAPAAPAAVVSAPSQPAPSHPAPLQPAPSHPAPLHPAPAQFAPAQPVPAIAVSATTVQPSQKSFLQKYSKDEAAHLRDQLASLAPELYERLDPNWKNYLALPARVFQGTTPPTMESLDACLGRFEAVRSDSRYTQLTTSPEFQSTYGLLRHYVAALSNVSHTLELPQPPPIGVVAPGPPVGGPPVGGR